jgi:hypothetical protein
MVEKMKESGVGAAALDSKHKALKISLARMMMRLAIT